MVFGMNYTENTICRVWPSRGRNPRHWYLGAESISNTLESTASWSTSDLVLSGKLYGYLADIDTQAQTARPACNAAGRKESVDEHLKAQDQLAWVGAMNNIRNRAEEIVLQELIYGEDVI